MPGPMTMKTLVMLVALCATASVASAENCRAIPPGPDRRACAMREHPEMVGAKQEHCRQLASEREEFARMVEAIQKVLDMA